MNDNMEKLIEQYRKETGINNPYSDYAHGEGWVEYSYTNQFTEWVAIKYAKRTEMFVEVLEKVTEYSLPYEPPLIVQRAMELVNESN